MLRMNPNESLASGDANQFRTTHWSVVLLSAQTQVPGSRTALADLCQLYWYPLYAFVRRRGYSASDAQDLTQEFFTRLLEKGWLEGVDQERGRFRSFLLAATKHFLSNERDRAAAQKRGGGKKLLPLDSGEAESRYALEPVDPITAERIFDRRWALTLLDQVLSRLRREFTASGKEELFNELKQTLTGDASSYAQIGERLGMTEGAVKVAAHRLRGRYRDLIRQEVAQTVQSPENVEDELRDLMAALSA